ncbi:arginine--tRNA ligase [Patescibacteria group bacterium]|nr:arginine--tRNA ligase [Patescibacteria group bacterium]
MKEELIKNIKSFLEEKGVKDPKVNLEYPTHIELGDYTTNVAMAYAKELGKKPLELAEEIKNNINVEGVTTNVVVPGFINFFFNEHYFNKQVQESLKNTHGVFSGKKFFIEHTQPNPFKLFHIGHLMNNAIGESVARIIKANGAEVQTATYHGDVGLHVAKAVWALKKGVEENDAYSEGHKAYEDDVVTKEEIISINKKIYDESDPEIVEIYENGRKVSLEHFENLYKRLGSHFDFHFYESESGEVGKELVVDNIGSIFEESEGAVIFRGENFEPKTHTRVFLNKEKLPTYEAKELGLAEIKKDFFSYDTSITITANEQDSFFKVVEVAIGEVFPDLKGKLMHLSHGLIKLPTGKMSSRTGSVISAEDMIDQVKEKVLEKIADREFTEEEKKGVTEIVSIGAIKYSILRQAIGGDIIFDFDKSISFEGDSGPYLQYATVRANSLLKKAEGVVELSNELPVDWKTTNLERLLERFPNVLSRAGKEYAPHHIVTYLIDLAGEFNSFYANHKIIDKEDSTSSYRLALTKAFTQVMESGLNLLGIKVPEKM